MENDQYFPEEYDEVPESIWEAVIRLPVLRKFLKFGELSDESCMWGEYMKMVELASFKIDDWNTRQKGALADIQELYKDHLGVPLIQLLVAVGFDMALIKDRRIEEYVDDVWKNNLHVIIAKEMGVFFEGMENEDEVSECIEGIIDNLISEGYDICESDENNFNYIFGDSEFCLN